MIFFLAIGLTLALSALAWLAVVLLGTAAHKAVLKMAGPHEVLALPSLPLSSLSPSFSPPPSLSLSLSSPISLPISFLPSLSPPSPYLSPTPPPLPPLPQAVADIAVSSLQRFPSILAVLLIAVAWATCGSVALCIGCLAYFLKLAKM